MKTLNQKLSNEQAQKELKHFLIVGYVSLVIAMVIFGWLAIVGLAAGGRCIVLTYHKGNAKNPKLKLLRTLSIVLVLASLVGVFLTFGSPI